MLLNVLGLTIAILVSILVGAYVLDELQYDDFHSKKGNIYRLYKRNVNPTTGNETYTTETSGMMGPTIAQDYPEVVNFTRVLPWFDKTVITKDETNVYIKHAVLADSSFFQLFDFKLIHGNPNTALVRPSSIILSESLAKSLFGDQDPVGEMVVGLKDLEYEVTGVVEDAPKHSHIQYDALISWTTTVPGVGPLEYDWLNNWLGQTAFTYLLISPNVNLSSLEKKMQEMMASYFPERANSYFLKFQPFDDVYLGSENLMTYSYVKQGSRLNLEIYVFTSLFILVIACVNYININTAKATKRSSEIGMRKVLGANKSQLVIQFLGESFILTLTSALFAILLADLSFPLFEQIIGTSISTSNLLRPELLLGIIIMVVFITISAGLYPAFVLSKFRPSEVLMSSGKSKISGHMPRQILSTIQFGIAITMIIGTIFVYKQIAFLKNKDLGFDKEHLLILNINNSIRDHAETFRTELLKNPDILMASTCQATLGSGTYGTTVIPQGMNEEMSTNVFRVDEDFIPTLGLQMVEGRAFDGQIASDSLGIIVNETFVKQAQWLDPMNMTIKFSDDSEAYPIIGVVKDFHFEGLNESLIHPIIMFLHPTNRNNVTLRITGNNIPETLSFIEKEWSKYESRFPFLYRFADSWFDGLYKKETQLMDAVAILSTISILLACMGLYGLTAFTIEQRAKEIGIRKVLGATVKNIAFMLNRKFVSLLFIAFIISAPIAYYFIKEWLANFPYVIDITLAPFAIALLSTLVITLAAVSIQTLKAAFVNPVQTLKSE